MPKLRVGVPPELYGRPLAWGFLKGHHGDLFTTSVHPQSVIAQLLDRGSLDVGLVSPLDLQRFEGLSVLRDLCAAAHGPTGILRLFSTRPASEVRRVAVEHHARTSALLLRIYFLERFGVEVEVEPKRPVLGRMLVDHDAALLTGDVALQAKADPGVEAIDLAEEWRLLTDRPWVFALWAVRDGVELPDLPFYFKSSLRYGLSLMGSLVRESAADLGLEVAEVERSLDGPMGYFLRDAEMAGIDEFFRRSASLGLIDGPRPVSYLS
ncbi:MAG: hypothetical protein KDD11_15385 [Acidobacteria bacterium]|nr:hypothetical protein [Acidobacteriota bacterium]